VCVPALPIMNCPIPFYCRMQYYTPVRERQGESMEVTSANKLVCDEVKWRRRKLLDREGLETFRDLDSKWKTLFVLFRLSVCTGYVRGVANQPKIGTEHQHHHTNPGTDVKGRRICRSFRCSHSCSSHHPPSNSSPNRTTSQTGHTK